MSTTVYNSLYEADELKRAAHKGKRIEVVPLTNRHEYLVGKTARLFISSLGWSEVAMQEGDDPWYDPRIDTAVDKIVSSSPGIG